MCSSALGPAIMPSFVMWPDHDHGHAPPLGELDEARRALPHLREGAGGGGDGGGPRGLDRIHRQGRRVEAFHLLQDRFEGRLRVEVEVWGVHAQALGPGRHLGQGLLAARVEQGPSRREVTEELEEERRFAHPGVSAQERHAAREETRPRGRGPPRACPVEERPLRRPTPREGRGPPCLGGQADPRRLPDGLLQRGCSTPRSRGSAPATWGSAYRTTGRRRRWWVWPWERAITKGGGPRPPPMMDSSTVMARAHAPGRPGPR